MAQQMCQRYAKAAQQICQNGTPYYITELYRVSEEELRAYELDKIATCAHE